MPEPDFTFKLGDTSSALYATLEDSAGDAVDIQAASVRFKMKPIDGGILTIDDVATNAQNGDGSDGTLGDTYYSWFIVPTEAGFYLGEFEVTYVSGEIQTFPNGGYVLVNVLEELV